MVWWFGCCPRFLRDPVAWLGCRKSAGKARWVGRDTVVLVSLMPDSWWRGVQRLVGRNPASR